MSFKWKFAHYLSLSTEKKIITEKQKTEIMELVASEGGNFGFFRILAIIWVLCIWIGILLVIASNWSSYPDSLQLLMALALPVIFLAIWYYFSYVQKELSILWTAFLFAGALSIGGAIALIGQIYHTGGTVWNLLLLWCILSIPLVFVFRLKVLAFLSISLFYGAVWYILDEKIFTSYKDEEKVFMSLFVISSLMIVYIESMHKKIFQLCILSCNYCFD
jgi:uncharacterized membrane protein